MTIPKRRKRRMEALTLFLVLTLASPVCVPWLGDVAAQPGRPGRPEQPGQKPGYPHRLEGEVKSVTPDTLVLAGPQGEVTFAVTTSTTCCKGGQAIPVTSIAPGEWARVHGGTDPTTGRLTAYLIRVADACRD
jgi:hypothetical protein